MSACSSVSTLPSSARTPRLNGSVIVDLLVDVFPCQESTRGPRWPAYFTQSPRAPNLHQLSGLDPTRLNCRQTIHSLGRHAENLDRRSRNAFVEATMLDRLSDLADPLTGLVDHRVFHDRLIEEFGRARWHGHSLSLVLAALDGFKHINDRLGHPAGDQALIEVAGCLQRASRHGDTLARL